MKISVLTVCRNAEGTIARTIASFLSQDYPEKEMLIIDGASTDRTVAVAESFRSPHIRILSEPDRGMYDALNKAIRIHDGDAFGVLNADDRFHDNAVLGRIAEALDAHDAVHGDLDFHDAEGRVVRRWRGTSRPRRGFASGWMPAHRTLLSNDWTGTTWAIWPRKCVRCRHEFGSSPRSRLPTRRDWRRSIEGCVCTSIPACCEWSQGEVVNG